MNMSRRNAPPQSMQMIYILGIAGEPKPDEPKPEGPISIHSTDSFASIYGLGYNKDNRWTFAGKKPTPLKEPKVNIFPET